MTIGVLQNEAPVDQDLQERERRSSLTQDIEGGRSCARALRHREQHEEDSVGEQKATR